MARAMSARKILLNIELEEPVVMNEGIASALDGLRLMDNGTVIIPKRLGGGLTMTNPAPCGTWEREL